MRRLLLIALAACGGSSTSTTRPEPPGEAPKLLGNPVWDGPLTDPMARKMLARVNATLDDPAPSLQGKDTSVWVEPVKRWVDRRALAGREIRRDADALVASGDPKLQLLAAIALGVAGDDLVTDMITMQLPAEVLSSEFGADIELVFRQTIEDSALPVAVVAREALQTCAELAPQSATLSAWAVFCRKRADSLAALEKRVGERASATAASAPKAPAKPPVMFSDCATREIRRVPPDALPPNRKAKPVVAFIYVSEDLKGDDVLALEAAVAAKLRADVKMPVVNAKELAAARALVTQKKLHAKGPVCGQAPPLPAVVAHKKKHVIVGEISTTCMFKGMDKTEECGLLVQYTRAGDTDQTGLPKSMWAPVAKRDAPITEWVAAVGKLAEHPGSGGLLGMLKGGAADQVFFDFSGYLDEDPWMRVADTLETDTIAKLVGCVDAAASFNVDVAISREGKTTGVTLAPITAPPPASKVTECVKQALEATPWPCTADGKPGKVSVRMCVAPRQ